MDNPFMARAIQLSVDNVTSGRGGPFGAVIVKNGRIIAEGVNRVTAINDPTAHAEVVAIREACTKLGSFGLEDCDIYTSCEPCPMCLAAAYWSRVDRIWFACTRADASAGGFDNSLLYEEIALPIGERQLPMKPLLRKEGLQAFAAWKASAVKIPY